ncbi:MAG: peptidylprolyl isomerase [Gammaproteobacteria bacterium]|jgi:peptidyl-prolyl cis-trans isomerase C|nr:peptidylprolyl isomerase [Gammaproteobacteria bacterium]
MTVIKTTLKQPLLHFVAIGAMLFIFFSFSDTSEEAVDESIIAVDRATLLSYMQYQANAFNEDFFSQQLDSMEESQSRILIEGYYREEALYREALAMGMDEGDYNIKQRMVEKLVFLLQGSVPEVPAATQQDLESYYADNTNIYRRDASYSFTHVFIDDQEHSAEGKIRAEVLLEELNESNIDFFGAADYGDAFPYLQNYVRRSRDFIRNNFDDDFAAWIDSIEPQDGLWQGSVESPFGFHVVMLSNRFPAVVPTLEEIRERVEEDYFIDTQYNLRLDAENNLVEKYRLEIGEI